MHLRKLARSIWLTGVLLAINVLCTATAAFSQAASTDSSTSAHTFQSPDGAFSVDVPAGWQTHPEEGSNEVSFLYGKVSVSIATAATEPGDTIEAWLTVNKSQLKEQCPDARVQAEGKAIVAGVPGAYFSMYCPGPRLPTTVRIAVSILNGQFLIFNTTAPTAQLAPLQAEIDRMAQSFRARPSK
jgi:hypothetical protein